MTTKYINPNQRLSRDAAIQATLAAYPEALAAIKAQDARTKQKRQYAPKGVVVKEKYGSHRKTLGLAGIKPSTGGAGLKLKTITIEEGSISIPDEEITPKLWRTKK